MNLPINVKVAVCKSNRIAADKISHYTTMPGVVKPRPTGEVGIVLFRRKDGQAFFPGAFTGDMTPVVKPGDVNE